MKQLSMICLLAASLSGIATPALMASNLVMNGGFETMNPNNSLLPADWGFTPASSGSDFWVSTWYPHSGTNAANFAGQSLDSIQQTVATNAGQSYLLSFFLDVDSAGAANDFRAYWDGTVVSDLSSSNVVEGAYKEYSAVVLGTGSDVLQFKGYDASLVGHADHLDDVSLTASAATAPEPASLWLLAVALLGFLPWRRLASRRSLQ